MKRPGKPLPFDGRRHNVLSKGVRDSRSEGLETLEAVAGGEHSRELHIALLSEGVGNRHHARPGGGARREAR
jgi:hypothetical protein